MKSLDTSPEKEIVPKPLRGRVTAFAFVTIIYPLPDTRQNVEVLAYR
jgi:hypothetical protein